MTDNWDPFADDSKVKDDIVTEVNETANGLELTITWKQSATTGAPWIIAKGDPDSVLDLVNDNVKLRELLEGVHEANTFFGGLAPQKEAASSAAPKAAGGSDAPNGESRSCKHGQMTYKTGSKNGRVWKAFMCPSPQGTEDQCAPQFLKG